MTREEVCLAARALVGTPFRKKGRDLAGGIDCLGVPVLLARHFGEPHTDQPDYSDWPDPGRRVLREMERQLRGIPIAGRRDGGIALFSQEVFPGHVGILSIKDGYPHLIHARMDAGGVIEEAYEPGSRNAEFRIIRLFAFPSMVL